MSVDPRLPARLGLPDKLQRLRDEFLVLSELSEHVLSINRVRVCLVYRLGLVSNQDVDDEENGLVLKWQVLELFAQSPDGATEHPVSQSDALVEEGWSVLIRSVEKSRVFKKGARVALSYDEITNTFMTIMKFAIQISASLQKFVPVASAAHVTAPEKQESDQDAPPAG